MDPLLIGIIVGSTVVVFLIVLAIVVAINTAPESKYEGAGGAGAGPTDPSGASSFALTFESVEGSGYTRVAKTYANITYNVELEVPGVVQPLTISTNAGNIEAYNVINSLETGFSVLVEQSYTIQQPATSISMSPTDYAVTSIGAVDGMPCIAFLSTAGYVYFVQALDAAGTVWGNVQTVDDSTAYLAVSLAVNDSNDVCIAAMQTNLLNFWKSSSSSWPTSPTTIYIGTSTGLRAVQLKMVNNLPSIGGSMATESCFFTQGDANGQNWIELIHVDTIAGYPTMCIAKVNGYERPAFAYVATGNNVFYRLSTTPTPTKRADWNTRVQISTNALPLEWMSSTLMNGKPVIAFYQNTEPYIKLAVVVATNELGSNWGLPYTAIDTGTASSGSTNVCSLVSSGTDSLYILHSNSTGDKLLYANSDTGGQIWSDPMVVDNLAGSAVGSANSMTIIDNLPVTSYVGSTALRFINLRSAYTIDWDVEQQ